MRVIGMDIHRVSAEVVALLDGVVTRLGRVDMRRDRLEAFARSTLTHDDRVVVEVLSPHGGRVVIANPKRVRLIADARIKTDKIDAAVLARLDASGRLPEVWAPNAHTEAMRRRVTRRRELVGQRPRQKNIVQSVLHAPPHPALPARRSVRPGRARLAGGAMAAAGRTGSRGAARQGTRSSWRGAARRRTRPRPARARGCGGEAADDGAGDRHGGRGRPRRGDRRCRPLRRSRAAGRLSRPEPECPSVGRWAGAARADHQAGARPGACHAGGSGLGRGTGSGTAAGLRTTDLGAPRAARRCGRNGQADGDRGLAPARAA